MTDPVKQTNGVAENAETTALGDTSNAQKSTESPGKGKEATVEKSAAQLTTQNGDSNGNKDEAALAAATEKANQPEKRQKT